MSRWWRAYDEAIDDPKIQRLEPTLFKAWFNLCCLCSQNDGKLPHIDDIAFKLRISVEKAKYTIDRLVVLNLIDELDFGKIMTMHNWGGRQFRSDVTDPTAAERQKKYRDKKRNATVTRPVTATDVSRLPETDTETDTDSEAKASADVVGEDPRSRLFRLGKTTLVSFGVSEKRTGALIGQWLKTKNDPIGLLAAIQFARDQNVAEPVAYISTLLKSNGKSNGKQDVAGIAFAMAEEIRRRQPAESLF